MTREPAKMGRPPKPFDEKLFEGLCHIQCTLAEISGVMNLSDDTVERRCKDLYGTTFAEVFKQKRAGGLISLRRAQFRLAETNAAMGIWLGKQYLEQSEPLTRIEITTDDADKAIDEALQKHNLPKPDTFEGEPMTEGEM